MDAQEYDDYAMGKLRADPRPDYKRREPHPESYSRCPVCDEMTCLLDRGNVYRCPCGYQEKA